MNLPLALTTEVSLHILSVIHLWSFRLSWVQEISMQTFLTGNINKAFHKARFPEECMSIFLATMNSTPAFLRQVLALCPKLAMQAMLVSAS